MIEKTEGWIPRGKKLHDACKPSLDEVSGAGLPKLGAFILSHCGLNAGLLFFS